MLERIASALEIDSPQLFSMEIYSEKAIKRFQECILSDLQIALAESIGGHIPKLSKIDNTGTQG